jgi:Centriolar protein SAS N-terminal
MDAEDALFYYEKKFDELEFTRLAAQQHILAGFDEFPARLKDFIQLILSHAQEPSPKFYAQLMPHPDPTTTESSTLIPLELAIYENNSFKQISLVSFIATPVPEESIKARLIDLNKRYKQEIFTLQNRLLDTERNLNNRLKESLSETAQYADELQSTKQSIDEHVRNISKQLQLAPSRLLSQGATVSI